MFKFKLPCCQKPCSAPVKPTEGMLGYCPECREIVRFMGDELLPRIANSEDLDGLPMEEMQAMIKDATESYKSQEKLTEKLKRLKPELLAKALAKPNSKEALKSLFDDMKTILPEADKTTEVMFFESLLPDFAEDVSKKCLTAIAVGQTLVMSDDKADARQYSEVAVVEAVIKALHLTCSDQSFKIGLMEALQEAEIEGVGVQAIPIH